MVTNKEQLDPQTHKQAQLLHFKSHSDILGKQVSVTTFFHDPLAHLEKCTEQVLAPLYALAYGLGIFFLDEFASCFLSPSWQPLIVIYVNLITILSFLYWITIWSLYWFHSRENHKNVTINSFLENIDNNFSLSFGTIVKLIICLGIYTLCIFLLPWNLMNEWGKVLIVTTAFAAPILLIGIFRACYSKNKGRLSYLHALGHFFAIVIYATCAIAILNSISPFTYNSVPLFSDIKIMRFSIVVFLLTIGILAPYIIPLWRHALIFKRESDKIETTDSQIQDAINEFNNKYNDLCTNFGKNKIKQALAISDNKSDITNSTQELHNNPTYSSPSHSESDSNSANPCIVANPSKEISQKSDTLDFHITTISKAITGKEIQTQSNFIHKYCKRNNLIDKETIIRSILHDKGIFDQDLHRRTKQQRHK